MSLNFWIKVGFVLSELNCIYTFIAFGPYKNPRYAVSIVIEHGGSGSSTAAPIAKKLFKFIVDRHEFREQARIQKSIKI